MTPRLASILVAGAAVMPARPVSALTVAFWLNNITYSNTSSPFGVTSGLGLISWSYAAGDFSNGRGQFVFLNLPPATIMPSSAYGPVYTADAVSVTGTITQNVDCYWYDWAVSFSPALSSPNSVAQVTGGSYDLTFGSCQDTLGQVTGGTLIPYQPTLTVRSSGTNVVVSWPTNYADGFVLESASSLKSGGLWTTSPAPASVLGENYVVTNNLAGGAQAFFRLVR